MSWSLAIADSDYEQLHAHLFPGDDDEHGAVLACGLSQTGREPRLLAREVLLAEDGTDFVAGERGYRQFTGRFVAEKAGYCRTNNLCYVSVHNHGGTGDRAGLSDDDLRSHERGYPAIRQMTGKPVAGLVFARAAVAGDVWTASGRHALSRATIIGPNIGVLRPGPDRKPGTAKEAYDRQALMFGARGQEMLGGLKVAVIGAGGGGSLVNQMLARLGVGHLLVIDPDYVEESNLSRIVGATRRDALGMLPGVGWRPLRSLTRRTVRSKVAVAERVARAANPGVSFEAVRGSVMNPGVARRLLDCDFVFLATDTIESRLLFDRVVHQYLIPGAQIGAKVKIGDGGRVDEARVVVRPVLPDAGCLSCGSAIPASRLREEVLSPEEREQQRYVDDPDVHEPSVITLNSLGASQAVNDFLFMFTGLHEGGTKLEWRMHWAGRREWNAIKDKSRPDCRHCGRGPKSSYARGDGVPLPTRSS